MTNRLTRTVWVGALMMTFMAWMTASTQPLLPKAKELPTDLDIVPRDAGMFVTVRVADMWENQVPEQLREMIANQPGSPLKQLDTMGLKISGIERATVVIPSIEPSGMSVLLIVATKQPYDKAKLLKGLQARNPGGAQERAIEKPLPFNDVKEPMFEPKKATIKCVAEEDEPAEASLDAAFYLIGDHEALVLIDDKTFAVVIAGDDQTGGLSLVAQLLKSRKEGALSDGLMAANQGHQIVMGVNPGLLMSNLPEDLPPVLVPLRALLKAKGMTITIDGGELSKMAIDLLHVDAAAAKKAAATISALRTLAVDMMPALRKELTREPEMKPFIALAEQFEKALDDATIVAKEDRVEIRAEMKFDSALAATVAAATQRVRAAAARAQAMNNLKQIALAFHNYESAYAYFPPASDPENQNKFPVSWRVRILPFIEQENLYRMYKFDEPWDSDNNKKLIPLMPKVYELPGFEIKEKGLTYFQVFTGNDAMFVPKQRASLIRITDGTSNTIMVAEAANAVVWTQPDDLIYDAKKPVPKLGGHFPNGFIVAMGDGSVRFIPSTIKEANLRAAITANGGEVLGFDD